MLYALFLVFFVGFSLDSVAGPEPLYERLKITTGSWESYINDEKEGVFSDLLKSLYEPVGVNLSFETSPFKRSLFSLLSNQTGGMLATYDQDF